MAQQPNGVAQQPDEATQKPSEAARRPVEGEHREPNHIVRCRGTAVIRRGNVLDIVFVSAMLALLTAFTIGIIADPTGTQANIFFLKTQNFFADYFNVAKMSADLNPYCYGVDDPLPWEHAYPPLCYLIFFFLSSFADYSGLDAFTAGYTTTGLVSAILFMMLLVVLFILLLRQGYRKQGPLGMLLPFALLGSSIVLHAIERGNIVFLAADCTMFFVLAYRSENAVARELALISLAVATALKGYPALIGMLLLFDRRWLAALRCALYGIALIFLPFLCFVGGFGNIPVWWQNIQLNSQVYGVFLPRYGFGIFALFAFSGSDYGAYAAAKSVLLGINTVICVIGLLSSMFLKTRWKQVLLLLLVIACLPTNSSIYLGLYLFVGFVLFFDEECHENPDWVYLFLMVLLLNPYQIIANDFNMTVYLMGASSAIMLAMLTSEAVVAGVRTFREHSAAARLD